MLFNRVVFAVVVLVIASPLLAQEPKKIEASYEQEKVIPTFVGEKTEKGGTGDPAELIGAAIEKLGGMKAFGELRDLAYNYKHNNYQKSGNLHSREIASGYYHLQDELKMRLDFESYPSPSELSMYLDYREIVGSEGPFKYLEGRVLRAPLAKKEAGSRLFRNYMVQFMPFWVDLEKAEPEYLGVSAWTPEGSDETVRCHKILIKVMDSQARIKGDVMAIYIDAQSLDLRRVVFLPILQGGKFKTKAMDYEKRVNVGGVQLPELVISRDSTKGEPDATHKFWYTGYQANTGLEGLGFEIVDQEQKEGHEPIRNRHRGPDK
jgi:hypothetical protein